MQDDLDPSNTSSPAGTEDPSFTTRTGAKRKFASSSSRGVASLTPEQLAKKRANDREAQRAIRERTKQQIETLERRIQELTSQQPYQELQVVIRQKDAIQAENDEIRRRLASVMSIIQPIVGAQGLTDLATAAQHNVHTGLIQQDNAFHATSIPASDHYLNGQQSAQEFSASPSLPQGSMENSGYPPQFEQEEANGNKTWPAMRDALSLQRDNLQRGLELNDAGERLSFNFLLDGLGQRAGNVASHTQEITSPVRRSAYPVLAPSLSEQLQGPWTALPKNIPPTCPLDGLLLNFLHSRQRAPSQDGSPTNPLLSPSYPSVNSLLNPSGAHRLDPLSQLMTDIISKFPNISGLPEQTGTLFLMFINMRWHLNPTKENYECLPEWYRPTPTQVFTPHAAWVDHIPWPRMRDGLIASQGKITFEDWFIPYTTDLSVNWPYGPLDCLLSTSAKEDPLINPVFEKHIRRMDNWTVGPMFAEAFPALADTVRIVPQKSRGDTSARSSSS